MINLLIRLVIAVVVLYCVNLLLPFAGLPDPFNAVALAIIGLFALLYVIGYVGDGWPTAKVP